MTTWIQVMAEVRALDDKRRSGKRLDCADAESLVTILLEFHQQTVARSPSGEHPGIARESPGEVPRR